MADLFVGKWNMESSENFDKYMKTVGVNALMASIGSKAKPTVYISVDGDTWTLKSETALAKTAVIHFKLGVEFDETTADDRKMKTTITLDGNKLVQDQKATTEKGVPSVITRSVEGNTMTVICQAKDVTSTRIYKKAA